MVDSSDNPQAPADPIPFPTVEVQNVTLQGSAEFYRAIQSATAAAFAVVAPFQDRHAVFNQQLGEVLRYLELTSMYMDRIVLFANNPSTLSKAGASDAPEKKD